MFVYITIASEITMTNSSDDLNKPNKIVDPDLIFEKGLLVHGIYTYKIKYIITTTTTKENSSIFKISPFIIFSRKKFFPIKFKFTAPYLLKKNTFNYKT